MAATTESGDIDAARAPLISAEQRLDREFKAAYKKPELIELEGSAGNFYGLYKTDTLGKNRGSVLLIPSLGGHADWPEAISPLRHELAEQGWHTLSINLPLPPAIKAPARLTDDETPAQDGEQDAEQDAEKKEEAKALAVTLAKKLSREYEQALFARLKSALGSLEKQGPSPLFILVQGRSSALVSKFIVAENPNISGFILLHAQDPAPPLRQRIYKPLEKQSQATLDIYFADHQEFSQQALLRKQAAIRGGNQGYKALRLDHSSALLQQDLYIAKRIHSWLKNR